jgi:fumarate reductase (CoM/CoB) subunit A
VLWKKSLELGVEYRPCTLATRLLTHNGIALAATALDFTTGEFIVIEAKAIILANGGIGQLYPVTTNPRNFTGDGLAFALDAGARLMNMEQASSTPCLVHPQPIRGLGLGILEYGKLRDGFDHWNNAKHV